MKIVSLLSFCLVFWSFAGQSLAKGNQEKTPILTKKQVYIVKKKAASLKKCYGLSFKTPRPAGQLKVEFHISAKGSIKTAAIKKSDFDNFQFHKCVVEAVKKWKLPEVADNKSKKLTFPINFYDKPES